jgi:RNA polymerase sigma factor (sigma-70 family)
MPSPVHRLSTERLLLIDREAGFERLVREHSASVLTFARRLCGNAAEDVMQEVFVQALRSLREFGDEDIADLRTLPWLLTITRNTSYSHHRSATRRPSVVGDVSSTVPDRANGPDSVAIAAESFRELEQALGLLTSEQREAIVLRHVLDLSSRDAAAVLQISENTLKSHLSRGLRLLRTSLSDARGAI